MPDSEFLKRLRYLSLAAGRVGGRSLLSSVRTRWPGGGTGAIGVRDYAPGDDYRYVDWTWCARRDELVTRVFPPEEDRHVYILLDCSPSMGLGAPSKSHLARRIAAALGYVALRNLDRLAVTAFSRGIVADLPPIRRQSQAPRLLCFLRELPLQGAQTDLKRTAEGFVRRYQRHGPVVVISDLYDRGGFRHGLDLLQHRGYEPSLVQIYAPSEADPGLVGELELFDVEAETTRRVTITERAARRYQVLFAEFREAVRAYCAGHGIACLQLRSDAPEDQVLWEVLGGRRQGVRIEDQGPERRGNKRIERPSTSADRRTGASTTT